ncbi:hypothetical protein V2J09_010397, partial [Rumex salicifolius]
QYLLGFRLFLFWAKAQVERKPTISPAFKLQHLNSFQNFSTRRRPEDQLQVLKFASFLIYRSSPRAFSSSSRIRMVYHTSFVDEEGVTKACGCPLLPLKSHIKGPAPSAVQDKADIDCLSPVYAS